MDVTEGNRIDFLLTHKKDGIAIFSANWDYANRRVGVWVRYGPETSHKEGFSMLAEGLWKAMQDPLDYIIEQEERGETTVKPYWDGLR